MMKLNSSRNGCKDVFNAFLVKNATYSHKIEIPNLKKTNFIPNNLISFSKAKHSTNYNSRIHFYEDDCNIEMLWKNPKRYLPLFKKFNGIIGPDFSVYRDMPLVFQQWNIYRSRSLTYRLQINGINIIPNIRFGDERTYELSCSGIESNSSISIGSHGCVKAKTDKLYFIKGVKYVIEKLNPANIIIYGTLPKTILLELQSLNINVVCFLSEFSQSRKAFK